MNILFIIPYTPTPIRTRPYHLLRTLARREHELTLATLYENEVEREALEEWRSQGVTVLAEALPKWRALLNAALALPTRTPLQARYCWEKRLAVRCERLVVSQALTPPLPRGEGRRFDVIHVEHLRGAEYGLYLKSALLTPHTSLLTPPSKVPIIWDSVDCISLLFEKALKNSRSLFGRWMTRQELPRTRRYEGCLVNKFDHTLVTAEADRKALEELAISYQQLADEKDAESQERLSTLHSRLSILPNGVDLERFVLPTTVESRFTATIVLSGKMSYHANVTAALWLVEKIMPLVWAERPDTQVQIVGNAPTAAVKALALRDPRHVTVTGYVEDIVPYLQQATLAADPLAYGVGIQNKVLEAMACAAPVVATSQAISALAVQDGQNLLLADDTENFARAILRLLGDPGLRQALGQAGRHYVEQNHNWEQIAGRLEEIYSAVQKR